MNALNGKSSPGRPHRRKSRWLAWVIYFFLLTIFIAGGAVAGLYVGFKYDLPEVKSLERYRPDVITEIYSRNNSVLGQFAIERRVILPYKDIPPTFLNAVIAAEDQNFFSHFGVDIQGILRALYKDIRAGAKVEGASTLTQQLSKLLFLTPETSWERKIKEAILAIQIENYYTKEQILTFYCNQIYMGDGTYGIASAAQHYFGKEPNELNLEECAMLAGILRSAFRYSPIYNPERALQRRTYVLGRMYAEKMISPQEYRTAMESPLNIKPRQRKKETAAYFLEWVRRSLAQKYETEEIWRKGLRVYTTLDVEMQLAAEAALKNGLREIDKKKGWRGRLRNVLQEGASDLEAFQDPSWRTPADVGSIVVGLVTEVKPGEAVLRIGSLRTHLDRKGSEWTGSVDLTRLLRRGDLVPVKIEKLAGAQAIITLEQHPEVQGALVLLDNASGGVLAMVGGYDFDTSKFNRATQALRQTGSAFKPLVYTAAIESGMNPDDTVLDAYISFTDGLGKTWAPDNYDGQFKGVISLRQALAESRNVPAVRLGRHVGVTNIIRIVRRFGITSPMQPYLPIAIGASEVSLLELTSAYSVFPNSGILMKPYHMERVEDYDHVEKEAHGMPQMQEVVKSEVASKMTSLLMGSVLFGTSVRALHLERPVAGKTGTTNDSTDAWFIGFTPSYTCGIWIGYDDKQKSLGGRATGGNIALPIWIEFMKEVLRDKPVEPFYLSEGVEGPPEAPVGWVTHQKSPVTVPETAKDQAPTPTVADEVTPAVAPEKRTDNDSPQP